MSRLLAVAALFALVLPLGCASIEGVSDLPTKEAGVDGTTQPEDAGGDARDAGRDHAVADAPAEAAKSEAASDAPQEDAVTPSDASDGGHHDATPDARQGDARVDAPTEDSATDAPADAPADTRVDAPTDAVADAPADSASDAPTVSVDVTPTPYVWLAQGGSTSIHVTLSSAATVETQISVTGLPTGVTCAPIQIAPGQTGGSLLLQADSAATVGVTSPTATAGSSSAPFELVVAGPSGSNDDSFNTTGSVSTIPTGGTYQAMAIGVAALSDSSLIVVGDPTQAIGAGWAIVKFDEHGTLDSTFATNLADTSKGVTPPTTGNLIAVVAIPGTDKVVAAGTIGSGATTSLALLMVNADGSRDQSFGTTGFYSRGPTDGLSVESVTGLAVSSSGAIAVVGNTTGGTGFLVILSGPNNSTVDQTESFASGVVVSGVAYVGGQKLMVGGYSPSGTGGQFCFTPVVTAGSLNVENDDCVGPTGAANEYLMAVGLASDPSGDAFVVGNRTSSSGDSYPAVAVVDETMNLLTPSGYADPGLDCHSDSGYNAVASDATGLAVAVGYGSTMASYTAFVARFKSDGSPDMTFGTGGIQSRTSTSDSDQPWYLGVTFDPVGRIVAVGTDLGGFYVVRMWP